MIGVIIPPCQQLAAKPGMQSTIARTRTVASTFCSTFSSHEKSLNRFGAASKSVPFLWLHYSPAARKEQSPTAIQM